MTTINLSIIYKKDGIVKHAKSGNAVGFYYGKAGDKKVEGVVTEDLEVAESILYCAQCMVKHIIENKPVKKKKAVKK